MTNEQFDKLLESELKRIKDIIIAKSKHYSFGPIDAVTGGDRLKNFKDGARITGETPKEVLWGYLTKHLVSIMDYIEQNKIQSVKRALQVTYSMADVEEKITDSINYLILLKALFQEDVK